MFSHFNFLINIFKSISLRVRTNEWLDIGFRDNTDVLSYKFTKRLSGVLAANDIDVFGQGDDR
jgi:hypothetical protein